jgi:hypothetical protein
MNAAKDEEGRKKKGSDNNAASGSMWRRETASRVD